MSLNEEITTSLKETADQRLPFEIHADVIGALTYASWQNSIPLLRSFSVENRTEENISGLTLEFETLPAFARPKRWIIDQLLPGENIALTDRHVMLDPEYLAGLNEAERGRMDQDAEEAARATEQAAEEEKAQEAASDALDDNQREQPSPDESTQSEVENALPGLNHESEETHPGNGNLSNELLFQRADLSSIQSDPTRFYEPSYSSTIRSMIHAVLENEAPVRDDVLAQRIARAHGWLRTGGSIRAHIDRHLRDVVATEEHDSRFLWRDEQQKTSPTLYRHPATDDDRRTVNDIALVELAAFVREHQEIAESPDPARVFARLIGLQRLATPSRVRLDAAIQLALNPATEKAS